MQLRAPFYLVVLSLFQVAALSAQVQDTMVIRQLLDQAAATDSMDLAREKYETAYTLAKQLDDEAAVLKSLTGLIPLELQQSNPTNALRYLLEERELLNKQHKAEELIVVNTTIGDLYSKESLYGEAIIYYQDAERSIATSKSSTTVPLLDKLGHCHTQLLQPDSAQLYYARMMQLHATDEQHQLSTLRKIVNAYQKAGQYQTALTYNLQIRKLMEASSRWTDELGVIYNNLGYTYSFLGRYRQATKYFHRAEDHFQEIPDRLASLYTNLGVTYFNSGETKLAIQYLLKALAATNQTDHTNKGTITNVLANIYLQNEDYFNAQNYSRDAVRFANQSDDTKLKSEVYATSAKIHSNLFEYEEAIKAYKIHLHLRDSMLAAIQLEQDRLFQEKLKLEKTEKEIRLLLIRGEIQDLTIEQLELERERQQLKIDNLNLATQQAQNDLAILQQSEEIREAKLKNQELENQRTKQDLLLIQGRLAMQEQERQLSELARAEALAKLEVERKEALLLQEEQRTALLEKEQEIQRRTTVAAQRIGLLLFLLSLLILAGLLYTRRTNRQLGRQKLEIEVEREKSESLLLNVLPYSTAQELKEKGTTTPRKYESVSIFFSDFVNFTGISAQCTPEQIIAELNDCFKGFDSIMEAEGVEKIQTIGDGYLAVGGLPDEAPDHAVRCVTAAKRIIAFLEERNRHHPIKWRVRIGIHSGEITAGVVGTKKFAYNIFGDAVNTASRLETASEQGRINVSASTYELIKEYFDCEYRGKVSAKGKGELDMYFVK